jgi:hypothetical protein
MACIQASMQSRGGRLSSDPSGRSLLPRLDQTAVPPRPPGGWALLRAAEHLDIRIGLVAGPRGGRGGRRIPAGWRLLLLLLLLLVLRCGGGAVGLVLRSRILFAALFLLPFLRHRENASSQLFAIAADGGLVPMLVRDPTTFLGRRTLCGGKVSGTTGRA